MGVGPVNLVVEDALSEGVCLRLLEHHSLDAGIVYGKEGYGFIKTRLRGFNHAAKGMCYLVLADLDRCNCAPELWNDWLPGIRRHPNLIFRVAVREVESWLLADVENLTRFLRSKGRQSFTNPDRVSDPKHELLAMASTSPNRMLREGVVFQNQHGKLLQGPDYNGSLLRFVQTTRDLSNAIQRSDSLRRASNALGRLRPMQ
jgi:hypothetical protein